MPAEELRLGYRSSTLRGTDRAVITDITMRADRPAGDHPLRRTGQDTGRRTGRQRAGRGGSGRGAGAARAKGMVLDPDDPDTHSAGSFFTNPILDAEQAQAADRAIHARLGAAVSYPSYPVKGGSRTRTGQAVRGLADRAGGLRQGVPGTRRPGRGVRQTHPGADQSRRQHGRSDRPGAGNPGRRAERVRRGAAPGATADRRRPDDSVIRSRDRSIRPSREPHVRGLRWTHRGVPVSARRTLTKGLNTVRRSPIGGFRGRTAAGVALLAAIVLTIAGCAGSQEDVVVTVTSTAVPAVTVSGLGGSEAAPPVIRRH